jgi:hypothetical protein
MAFRRNEGDAMSARIYQRAKNAMQSGKARLNEWVLEYEPQDAMRPDPLTGWPGSSDTRRQLRLRFDSLEAAVGYAKKLGVDYRVQPPQTSTLKLQAYADNFK